MFGKREILCTQAGTWNSPPPTCSSIISIRLANRVYQTVLEIWCDTPPLRPGMKITGVTLPVYPRGEMLHLSCEEGHITRGNLKITCQSNARWTRPDGDCQSN